MVSRDEALQIETSLSSFGQTLFNACNMLMGVGLLSLPYAMRLAGLTKPYGPTPKPKRSSSAGLSPQVYSEAST